MTAVTDVGLVRTNNEDNFIVNPDLSQQDNWYVPANVEEEISLGENGCVLVVADGMGGMNAGEVASELAVAGIKNAFMKVDDFSDIVRDVNRVELFLRKIVVDADTSIKKRLVEDPSTVGMGTTIVVVWVLGSTAHIVWCGDSRAYLFNPNSGISRLTKDHSFVQELVDSGKLDAELAFNHPNSNIITRSLGDSPAKARPDYVRRELQKDDVLLLCSDGLCGLCRDEEIVDVMNNNLDDLAACRDSLVGAALNAGGYDNVTVALMKLTALEDKADNASVATINDQKRAKRRKIISRIVWALLLLAALTTALVVTDKLDVVIDFLKEILA